MAILENWKIRKRLGACEHTGDAFEDGEVFYTAIFPEEESDGYVRRDYSEKSWKALRDKLGAFSSWRSKYEMPPEEEPEEVVREDAHSLLRRLIEEDKPETDNARFILAAMLERKKLIIETDVRDTENDARIRFYEDRASGDVFIVRDPNLHLEQVEDVQQDVAWLLEGKDPEEERRKLAMEAAGEGSGDAQSPASKDAGSEAESAESESEAESDEPGEEE